MFVGLFVPGSHGRRDSFEKRCSLVGQFERAPVLIRPGLFDLDLIDRLLETSLGDDGNGEPLHAIGGLDLVAVVPVPLNILHAVEYHVLVAAAD